MDLSLRDLEKEGLRGEGEKRLERAHCEVNRWTKWKFLRVKRISSNEALLGPASIENFLDQV